MSLTRTATMALLDDHGLHPKRKLGQNFVVDANTLSRIVRLSGIASGASTLEIGAGLGALTEVLLESGAAVTALEIDPDLAAILRARPELATAQIVEGDALAVDLDVLAPPASGPWSLVANLPYNVATPVVLRVLEQAPQITRILVMVQLEVAERLAAGPGNPAYGGASVRVAYHATSKVVGKVPPTVFIPKPKVDSGLVLIERRATPAVDVTVATEDEIFTIVRMAFGQRRKMLRRSLVDVVTPEAFEAAGIAPTARPEEIDVAGFGRLAAAVR
ncbi:MAG: 16S rRNA (adenine(1518)-N(6)/adenine(1519)-N(6))-dimethyltransferase RsmA [Actinomycetes bacterium]